MIKELLSKLEEYEKCKVSPPSGEPVLEINESVLPEDLKEFYSLCGGAEIFSESFYGWKIVRPEEFKPSNPILWRSLYPRMKEELDDDDYSFYWYLLCTGHSNKAFIVVDCHPERLGRCYEAYLDVYGTGDMKILSLSFTGLLENIIRDSGEGFFWEKEDFEKLGYVFDGIYE